MSAFSDLLAELDGLVGQSYLCFDRDLTRPLEHQWGCWVFERPHRGKPLETGHSAAGEGALHDLVQKLKAAKAEETAP